MPTLAELTTQAETEYAGGIENQTQTAEREFQEYRDKVLNHARVAAQTGEDYDGMATALHLPALPYVQRTLAQAKGLKLDGHNAARIMRDSLPPAMQQAYDAEYEKGAQAAETEMDVGIVRRREDKRLLDAAKAGLDTLPLPPTGRNLAGSAMGGLSDLAGAVSTINPLSPASRREDFSRLGDAFRESGRDGREGIVADVESGLGGMIPAVASANPAGVFAATAASHAKSRVDAENERRRRAGLSPLTATESTADILGNAALMGAMGPVLGKDVGLLKSAAGMVGLDAAATGLDVATGVAPIPTAEELGKKAIVDALMATFMHGVHKGIRPSEPRSDIDKNAARFASQPEADLSLREEARSLREIFGETKPTKAQVIEAFPEIAAQPNAREVAQAAIKAEYVPLPDNIQATQGGKKVVGLQDGKPVFEGEQPSVTPEPPPEPVKTPVPEPVAQEVVPPAPEQPKAPEAQETTGKGIPKGPFTVEWGTRSGGNKSETFEDFSEAQEVARKKGTKADFATLYDGEGNEHGFDVAPTKSAEVPPVEAKPKLGSKAATKDLLKAAREGGRKIIPGTDTGGKTILGAVIAPDLKPVIDATKPIVTDAIEHAVKPITYFGRTMGDRVAAIGGELGKAARRLANAAIDKTRENYGKLSEPMDAAMAATGKIKGGTAYGARITVPKESSKGDWGYRNTLEILEGDPNKVPEHARPMADKVRTANRAAGDLAFEAVNRAAEKAAADGEPTLFDIGVERKATGAMQRIRTPEFMDSIMHGNGPLYEASKRALAEANKIPVSDVEHMFQTLRAESAEGSSAGVRKMSQEFERVFPNHPTSVKLPGPLGGHWVDILVSKPHEYIKAVHERTAARAAFMDTFGDKKAKELRDGLAKGDEAAVQEYDALIRTLHWVPADTVGMIGGKRIFDASKPFAMNVVKPAQRLMTDVSVPLSLSQSVVGNMLELAKLPSNYSPRDWIKLARNWTEYRGAVEMHGDINRAHYNNAFDPHQPIQSALRMFRNKATQANMTRFTNELTELSASLFGKARSARMQAGEIGKFERYAVMDDIQNKGFSRTQAERMVDGEGTAAEYGRYERAEAGQKTGGNLVPAEGSRFSNNRLLSGNYPFMNYPMTQGRQTVSKMARFYEAMQSGDKARIASSFGSLSKNILLHAAGGAALQFFFAAAKQDLEGEKSEFLDHPGTYAVESWAKGMGGPLSIAYELVTGPRPMSEKIVNVAAGYNGGKIWEATQAFTGGGQYRNLDMTDAALKLMKNQVPIGRTLATTASALGIGESWPRIVTARNRYYQYYPPGGTGGEETDWGVTMEKLHKAISDGNPVETHNAISAVLADLKSKGEKDPVRAIQGKRIMKAKVDPEEIKKKIGADNYEMLRKHDELVKIWAGAIEDSGTYEPLGKLKLEQSALHKQKAAFDEARKKGTKSDPYDHRRLERLNSIKSDIDEVQQRLKDGKIDKERADALTKRFLGRYQQK